MREMGVDYLFCLHIIINAISLVSLINNFSSSIYLLYRKKSISFTKTNNLFPFHFFPCCCYCKIKETSTYPIQLAINIVMVKTNSVIIMTSLDWLWWSSIDGVWTVMIRIKNICLDTSFSQACGHGHSFVYALQNKF